MVKDAVCGDCKNIIFFGGVEVYGCASKDSAWNTIPQEDRKKVVEERIPIDCVRFDVAPRDLRIKMREYREVGITKVYGNGSVQLPSEIRQILRIKDGDKILWIRRGREDFSFRKVGFKGERTREFKPHYQ